MANRRVVPTSGICSPRERPTCRRRSGATTALSWSNVRARTGKTKVKMSASTKQNSNKHISGAQGTGVHQVFSNGPQRGREKFNTHNVTQTVTHARTLTTHTHTHVNTCKSLIFIPIKSLKLLFMSLSK